MSYPNQKNGQTTDEPGSLIGARGGGHRLTLKGVNTSLNDLRTSLQKQIGHERDSRVEHEHRVDSHLSETATHHDIALLADSAGEAKETSKKTQEDMVNLSLGLRYAPECV